MWTGIHKMDAVFKDAPLENILNEVLKGTGLYYEIQGKGGRDQAKFIVVCFG